MIKVVTLMSSKPYMFKHSISTTIFATLLGIASGIKNEKNLSILALGAFLHDVGESQLAFDPEDKIILTPEERKELYRHPSLGIQAFEGSKTIKQEVLDIILQHHEQPNGHGYPNGMREGEIYHPAKIVSIADTFASLINKRQNHEAMNTEEAINAMMSDVGKYDRTLLRTFHAFFFPKPKS
jgi:HD-GYP domain-containing protein (c-di-GMP phosphodiesterase class II)